MNRKTVLLKTKKNIYILKYALIPVLLALFIVSPLDLLAVENKDKEGQSSTLIYAEKTDISLKKEAQHALDMALNWLKNKQNQDGSWSSPDYPALTALVTLAFIRDPSSPLKKAEQYPPFLQKALGFIIGKVQPDGGIYTPDKGLSNYNTAISMTTLLATGNQSYEPVIQKARKYLISLQKDEGEKGVTDNPFDGGIGYGSKDHSDMSNMYIALEAIAISKKMKTDPQKKSLDLGEENKTEDLNWEAALRFVERCQNNPNYNDQRWASNDPNNYGGFVYFPGESKAGEVTLSDGSKTLRSYGSMTYAGLLSFIYAELERDDPRVRAAFDWITRHYTLDENPGLGQQGLYYNYHTMAKALAIYGEENLDIQGRKDKVGWRKDLLEKLISIQKGDGYWVNDQGRWWENDPVLVTAYSVLAMEIALSGY